MLRTFVFCFVAASASWAQIAPPTSPVTGGSVQSWQSLLSQYAAGNVIISTNPLAVAFDGSNLWITNLPTAGFVSKVSSNGNVIASYSLSAILSEGFMPTAITCWGPNVFVAGSFVIQGWNVGNGWVELQGSDGKMLQSAVMPSVPSAMLFDGSSLWIIDGTDLLKYDVTTAREVAMYSLNQLFTGMTFDGANIWLIADTANKTVTEISVSDGEKFTYEIPFQPVGIAFDGTEIWVTGTSSAASSLAAALRPADGKLLGVYVVPPHF